MEKTMNYKIGEALSKLRPAAEWYLSGDDYSNLKWLDKKQTQPTWAEVEATIIAIDQAEAQAVTEAAAKRQALLAKLGITEEEAKLLLS